MTVTDRSGVVSEDVAIKLPVVCATTAAISLSGTQTIDGVAVSVGDRVLVKDQSDETTNGIYDVVSSGWTRSLDCSDAFAFLEGTIVLCLGGTANGPKFWKQDTASPEVGSTSLTFVEQTISGSAGVTGDTGDTGATGSTGATGAGYGGTSATSLTIGTGSLTFTTQAGMAYTVGARIRLSYASDGTKFMEGLITAYSSTSMTFTSDYTAGSGTLGSWNLNLAGAVGTTGSTGATGAAGAVGADYTTEHNLNSLIKANLGTTGIIARTQDSATASFSPRTITGTANLITVTDGDGVAGNPTLTVGSKVLRTDSSATVTVGFPQTPYDWGTKSSSANFTPLPSLGMLQTVSLAASSTVTITAPTTESGCLILQVTNGGATTSLTLSGFSVVFTGDNYAVTSGKVFWIYIYAIGAYSAYQIKAVA